MTAGSCRDNPNGYTTQHGIHSLFESTFVTANIKAAGVAPLMTGPQVLTDPFTDYMAYLRRSGTQIERLYQLDKVHGFDGAGTAGIPRVYRGTTGSGASMLRDMIYTAWVESAKPVPEWHPSDKAANATGGATPK